MSGKHPKSPTHFTSAREFRARLVKNHASVSKLRVGCYKKSAKKQGTTRGARLSSLLRVDRRRAVCGRCAELQDSVYSAQTQEFLEPGEGPARGAPKEGRQNGYTRTWGFRSASTTPDGSIRIRTQASGTRRKVPETISREQSGLGVFLQPGAVGSAYGRPLGKHRETRSNEDAKACTGDQGFRKWPENRPADSKSETERHKLTLR
jgi:hypothetical protein